MTPNRRSGILLHPTSLPGPHGSGDFGPAAYHFVDWLVAAGQRLWQVLPLTPIGPGNSPYASVSAFAGSPWLVALEPLIYKGWIEAADRILEEVSLAQVGDAAAATLPHGDQRKLEVAVMMALEPHVMMFDEPTAGMSVDEVPVVLDLIRRLKARGDRTILLVEHKMDVVRSLADRIVVLHNGRLVADGEPADVIASPIVQEAYLGVAAPAEAAHG